MVVSKFPLNPKQLEAVQHGSGPLLILAGAGSGKTRVLVERMIHLIREQKVSPYSILAVTFTNKAAREMKNRVRAALGSAAETLWLSTFHSSCLRILRRHADRMGYSSHFAIYDDHDQKVLLKKIIADMNLSENIYKPRSVQYHINQAKHDAIFPENFSTHGEYYLKKVQEIYAAYQQTLTQNEAMDFGDLILNVIALFKKHPDVLREYQDKFAYVLVDEYQDTNVCQYLLLKLLVQRHRNICVVGDDDQSIYKFRGAQIRNILDFQNDFPDARVIRLEQNYRSTKTILAAAHSVIRNNEGRMGKELWTENLRGEKIRVFESSDDRREANCVCRAIAGLRQEFHLRGMAVFYRTNAQSRPFEDEFRKLNIPYRIFGGMRFYDRAEIKDTLAYLRVLVNPADSVSLKRIVNVPPRGIGKTTITRLDDLAAQNGSTLWEVLNSQDLLSEHAGLNAKTVQKLQSFVSVICKLEKVRREMPLSGFLPFVYEQTGYWQMLTQDTTIEAESRLENLREFVNVAEEFTSSAEETSLEAFLDQISLASDIDNLDECDEYVTLMTVHLAKGLEFPVVFMVGLEEGLFPHVRSLDTKADLEEERRLFYVGMTRAKQVLHLCFARERHVFGSPQYNVSSRFLEEIGEEFLEQHEFVEEDRFAREKIARGIEQQFGGDHYIDLEHSQTELPFKKGSVVRHQVFGNGRVLGFDGDLSNLKVTIRFQTGVQKKLLLKHAHLTLLQE